MNGFSPVRITGFGSTAIGTPFCSGGSRIYLIAARPNAKGITMGANRLSALLAAAVLTASCVSASGAEPMIVETWPDDIPCNVLKKHPDGAYEITVPWIRFFTTHTGGKWKNTRETAYWDK